MQLFVNKLARQATQHSMNVNSKKTKEMLMGLMAKNSPLQLTLGDATEDRVDTFKLNGVHSEFTSLATSSGHARGFYLS